MSTRRVEKKDDPLKGRRYFLELEVKDLIDGVSYILAEYVFRPKEEKKEKKRAREKDRNGLAKKVHILAFAHA